MFTSSAPIISNAYFTSIGLKLADHIPATESNVDCQVTHTAFFLNEVDGHTVTSIISGMLCYKAIGHDGITAKSLKANMDVLVPVLTEILIDSIS